MAPLLIPTRNRPASLELIIKFLDKYYPGTEVIIADGSMDEFAEKNKNLFSETTRPTKIEYLRYPYELGFFDRILDVLNNIDDEYLIMASDDDYPLINRLNYAEKLLKNNPNASTALGPTLMFKLNSMDNLTASISIARQIISNDALTRMRDYCRWSFSTTYAVTKRELLIQRYRRAREVFLPGFFDFGVGLHDCFTGKILTIPEFTFIATRNFNHSYLRASDKFNFINQPKEFFTLYCHIKGDLVNSYGLSEVDADDETVKLLSTRIQENLINLENRNYEYIRGKIFKDKNLKKQLINFQNTFKNGKRERNKLLAQLKDITINLVQVAKSHDNKNEPTTVSTLDKQMKTSHHLKSSKVNYPTSKMFDTREKKSTVHKVLKINQKVKVNLDNLLVVKEHSQFSLLAKLSNLTKKTKIIIIRQYRKIKRVLKRVRNQLSKKIIKRQYRKIKRVLKRVRNQLSNKIRLTNNKNNFHILILGQSNVANHLEGRTKSFAGVAFDSDGKKVSLSDPIEGGTGTLGSVWPSVANYLRDLNVCNILRISLRAKSGSSIYDWSEGGNCFLDLKKAIPIIKKNKVPISHVIWHQGEADTLRGTSKEQYIEQFRLLFNFVQKRLSSPIWIICRSSYRQGKTSQEVISAQEELANLSNCTFPGPNTDILGEEYRKDGTHFNALGREKFAKMLALKIQEISENYL